MEDISRVIDVIKDNVKNLEVESSTKLKIEISSQESNEELVQKLQEFIEKGKTRTYNVGAEYDETTGLVKYIILTIVEEKR